MLLAVMADSHDNLPLVRRAVARARAAGATAIVHLGDIVAPFAARIVAESGVPVYAVFGNNDGERRVLAKELPGIVDPPRTLELDGRRLVLFHAPPETAPPCDAVLFGHTHKPSAQVRDGVLRLNPGEAGGWLFGEPTMALLETGTLAYEFVRLDE